MCRLSGVATGETGARMGKTFARRWSARVLPALGLAAALAATAGCGGAGAPSSPAAPGDSSSQAPEIVRAATLRAGQPVPVPAGKALLTLTGKVSAVNKDSAVALDRAGLAQLGLVQVRVYEPWVKQTLDFRGVWLADLLKVAGADSDVSTVRVSALDDYFVDLRMSDIQAGGILLATEAGDGTQIPIEKGGPTRIVFLNGVRAGANADQWIWSLKTIDAR